MDDDVEIIERRTSYQGYFRIDRYRLRHRARLDTFLWNFLGNRVRHDVHDTANSA